MPRRTTSCAGSDVSSSPASVTLPLPNGYYGHLHNIYVHYAAERGVPAAIILTAAVLYVGSVLFGNVGGLFRQLFPGRHLEA